MVGQRADLLVAGLAGNPVAQDEGMTRPGTPLPWLVGAAEEDDGERAGRGGQVRRSGVGADEQVGSLQEGGGLRDGHRPGPVAESFVGSSPLDSGMSSDPPTTTTRHPSSRKRSIRFSTTGAASAWPRCRLRGARPAAVAAVRTDPRAASRRRRGSDSGCARS